MNATKQAKSGHTAAAPKVMECVCKHEFQDKFYGPNSRF